MYCKLKKAGAIQIIMEDFIGKNIISNVLWAYKPCVAQGNINY